MWFYFLMVFILNVFMDFFFSYEILFYDIINGRWINKLVSL